MKLSVITATQEPEATDPPAGHTQMTSLVDNLERYSVGRFATKAARDAAIPSPTAGMVCWCAHDGGGLMQYNTAPSPHWRWLPRGVVSSFFSTATSTSGLVGTTLTEVASCPAFTSYSGHVYRMTGSLALGTNGSGGALAGELQVVFPGSFSAAATAFLPGPSVAIQAYATATLRVQAVTSTGIGSVKIRQGWWAVAPIYYTIDAEHPLFATVEHLGTVPGEAN